MRRNLEKSLKRSHIARARLKGYIDEHEEEYIRKSDAEIDSRIAFFDAKRVFAEDPEAVIKEGIGLTMLKKLAKISSARFFAYGPQLSVSIKAFF
ncbi:MAG: hypothetical protein ACPL4E_10375 [Thermoproteota archaeon]